MFWKRTNYYELVKNGGTEINLRGRSLGLDEVKQIARALLENTKVKTLHLDSNNIGPEGVKALATGLERNTTLQC